MPLTIAERKHRMPFGGQKEVALSEGVSEAFVSQVMADERHPKTDAARKTVRRIQVAVARKLRLPVDEVFPPAEQSAEAA